MKVLITGPCGSGKTSVIEELERRGFQTTTKLEKELWFDENEFESFECGIMNKRAEIYKKLGHKGLIFFDRGVIDPIVYRKYEGKEILEEFDKIAKECKYDIVFVIEPLDKHAPNPEFDHMIKTKEDAKKWFNLMLETLKEYGYEPIRVKNMPINNRAEFILKSVEQV